MPARKTTPTRRSAPVPKGRFARPRFPKALEVDAKRAVGNLRRNRDTRRMKMFNGSIVPWAVYGATTGALAAVFANPSFRNGIMVILATAGFAIGAGKIPQTIHSYVNRKTRGEILKATQRVGYELGRMSSSSRELRKFLETFRYVYVNGDGYLVGTNMPRLIPGLGRMRLSTKKILAGAYPSS